MVFRGGSSIKARGGLYLYCPVFLPGQHLPGVSLCQCMPRKGRLLFPFLASPSKGGWVGYLDISHRGHPSNGPYPSSSQQALSTPSLTYLSPCPARIISLSLQLLILFQRFYAQSRGLVMAFSLKFQCCPSFSIIRSLCCLSSRF